MVEEVVVKIQKKNLVRKTPKYFPYLVTFCMLFWLGLFIDRIFAFQDPNEISKFTEQISFVAHFFILISSFKILKTARQKNRTILLWFIITNIGLLIDDSYTYFIVFFTGQHNFLHVKIISILLGLIPIFIWGTAIVVFLFKILKQYVLQVKYQFKTLFAFIFINLTIVLLFLSSVHYADEIMSLTTVSQIVTFIIMVIVFDFVILCLICAESLGIILFLLGFIGLISGYFFPIYEILSQTSNAPAYGELFWFLGLLFNWFGIVIIEYNKDYDVKNWVRKDSSIKSKLVSWCFSTAIIGFLLFFVIAYAFSLISKVVFLGLPLFIMIYSAIIISASLYIGEYFEEPFKKIENNIKMLMLKDKPTDMNEDFSIEEFIFLQKFIVESFTKEREAEQLRTEEQEKFRTIVKNMLHDINSPISSLGTIAAEAGSNMPENTRVTLRQATERIGDITHNLIFRYENKDSENEKKILLVSDALLEVMREKRYEYHDSHVQFETIVDKASANFVFTKTVPGDFKRMISNLINNAVEAVKHKIDGKVILELASTPKHVVIAIEDNGNGMPKHIQEKFKNGIAVTEGKEGRHSGVGLTQIRGTILASGGTFDIYVTDKVKTRIVIKFPLIPTPAYIAAEIKLTKDDLIIILDDDDSIHSAWDARFATFILEFPTLRIKHFTHGKDAVKFINELATEQKEDTILLTDYELLGQDMNGLEVVRETNMSRAILVTSYASKADIQELVVKAGIRTLPKDLASAVPITVDKKIPKWSSNADIVWIEDQKYFVDNLVSQYYSHLKVDVYYDPVNFLQDLHQYPLTTRIILDTYYEDQNGKTYTLTGYDIAEKLHNMGYTKLILISGEPVDQKNIPEYLIVILKTDADNLKTLDRI